MTSKTKVAIINEYNIILKRIINFYHDHCPNKDSSYRHIRRARVFIDADPKSALEITGAKLFKYKDIVMARRPDKISHNVENEQKETLDEYSDQKDIAAELIDNVLVVWQQMAVDQKNELSEQLIDMLRLYAQYVMLEKAKN